MTARGYKSRLFVDGIDLSFQTSQIVSTQTVNPITYNVLQNSSTLKVAGTGDHNLSINGYFFTNDATDIRAKVQTALTSEDNDTAITVMLDTAKTTPLGVSFASAFASEFTIETPIDNLVTVQGKFEKIADAVHGIFVANTETVDATGALTNYGDFGTIGSAGGDVVVIVTDITGSATDATIVIESDDNTGFSSAATEATLQFSSVGVVTGTMSGTVDRYIRARCTDLGGATDFTLSILVGVNGITQ